MKLLRFKKLDSDAMLPTKAYEHDAGFDLIALHFDYPEDRHTAPYIVTVHTGLAVEIPEGYVGLLLARSSIYKHNAILSNGVGVIDSGFRGEIIAKFYFQELDSWLTFNYKEKFAQLVVVALPEFEAVLASDLSESQRGGKGFGSSDRGASANDS